MLEGWAWLGTVVLYGNWMFAPDGLVLVVDAGRIHNTLVHGIPTRAITSRFERAGYLYGPTVHDTKSMPTTTLEHLALGSYVTAGPSLIPSLLYLDLFSPFYGGPSPRSKPSYQATPARKITHRTFLQAT